MKRSRFVSWALLLLLPLCGLVGCDTGSRGDNSPQVTPADPTLPAVISITPEEGCGGNLITVFGANLDLDPANNRATFRNTALGIDIPGNVVGVVDAGTDEAGRLLTNLTVQVPTNVRTSNLAIDTLFDGEYFFAGSRNFSACPVIVGVIYGPNNAGFLSVSQAGAVTPDSIIVYGYNVGVLTRAQFTDASGAVLTAPTITPGSAATIPAGMGSATIELPNGISILCAASEVVELQVENATGTGVPLLSNKVDLRYRLILGGAPEDMTATISSANVTTGVLSGLVEVRYTLMSDPASEQWDVFPTYEDPTSGAFLPCTPASTASSGNALLPGIPEQVPVEASLIGPGHVQTFVWDMLADLPPPPAVNSRRGMTRVRLNPVPDITTSVFICDTSTWETGPVAFDNSALADPLAIVGESQIFEDFETTYFRDTNATTTGVWPGEGGLNGVGLPATTLSPFGSGTIDVVLETARTYQIDTDFGSVFDMTNILIPIDMLPTNPGAASGEFHVRTLVVQDGAIIQLLGSRPFVVRASGTGTVEDVAIRIDEDLNVSGGNGTAGDAIAAGTGGLGICGGGDGGNGGSVTVIPGEVTAVVHATDGGNNGGKAGESSSYVRGNNNTSTARGGPGGGGGHAMAGASGVSTQASTVLALPGPGGPVRGDARLFHLTTGSGGGGGGACASKTNGIFSAKHGGGGGAGGGGVELVADGSIVVNGRIRANGGNGATGTQGVNAGGGGGGSGGAIALRASGGIGLGSQSFLSTRGGLGSSVGTTFGAGNGADGRIRIEANGGMNVPGLVNFNNVMPSVNSATVSAIATTELIDVGTGVDGPLNLVLAGTYVANTNTGVIVDPNGVQLPTIAQSGMGEWHLTSLVIAQASTLRAFGDNPLILRVSGAATVEGTIDLSGAAGGLCDFAVADPQPGSGGVPGAGGGAGGEGGVATGMGAEDGEDGQLPAALPAELIGGEPPFSSGGSTGTPLPPQLAIPAVGGESVALATIPGAGGGGGFGTAGVDASNPISNGANGTGGNAYLNNTFVNPNDGSPVFIGGAGGAGGGGSATASPPSVAHSPGTGGGGGGGAVQVSVGGVFRVTSTARVLARGGDAFRAPTFGGNAGAGSGGAIRLQGRGLMLFDGPVIDARGGTANRNVANHPDPAQVLAATYTPNSDTTGGNGGVGRILIESPLGFNLTPPSACAASTTVGICPPATIGSFWRADATSSVATSRSYRVRAAPSEGVIAGGGVLGAAVVEPQQVPDGGAPTVLVFFRGAVEDQNDPGKPGAFSEWTDDVTTLQGASFIQMKYELFGQPTGAGGALQPALDSVTIPITY